MPLNSQAVQLLNNLGLSDGVKSDLTSVINASSQLTQQLNDYANRDNNPTISASSSGDAGVYFATSANNDSGGNLIINTSKEPSPGFSQGYSFAETLAHELGHAFDPSLGTANLAASSNDPLGTALIQTRSEAVAEVNSYTDMSQARASLIATGTNASSTGAPLIDPSNLRVTAFPTAEAAIAACLTQVGNTTSNSVNIISIPSQCVDAAEAVMAKDPSQGGVGYLKSYYEANGGTGSLPNKEVAIDQNGVTTVTMNTADPSTLTFSGDTSRGISTELFTNNPDGSFSFSDIDTINGSQFGKSTYDFGTSGAVAISLNGSGYQLNSTNAVISLGGGTSATVAGASNQISLTQNDSLTVDGGGNDVSGTNQDTVEVYDSTLYQNHFDFSGRNDEITDYSSAGVEVTGNGVDLVASNNGAGAVSELIGNGNSVYDHEAGGSVILDGTGNFASFYSNNESIITQVEGDVSAKADDSIGFEISGLSSERLTGSGDSFSAPPSVSGDSIIVDGEYDPFGLSYDTVDYAGSNDAGDIVTGTGDTGYGWYGGGGGYYGGYYGLAGSKATVAAAVGSDIGTFAAHERALGNASASAAASVGHRQVSMEAGLYAATGGQNQSVLEAAKWDRRVVTWSLASMKNSQDSQFLGSLDKSYEAAVKSSFDALSKASGITFKEVTDSSSSNIRVGSSDFDTANSGIVGYTTIKSAHGALQSAVIRLEDPSQTALAGKSKATSVYAGTDAQFQQVLEHEIGHAIGLGDNADPTSIMFYELNANNRKLDSTDLTGLKSLYGGTKANASLVDLHSLTQAMSSFEAPPSAHTTQVVANETHWRSTQLLGAGHRLTAV